MPHKAKIPRPPSRSRFQEGSMNDRTSATPPVHFIGPDERAMLEKPLPALPFSMAQGKPRPVSYDPAIPLAAAPSPVPTPVITKRGSKQFLGQMWDGVMGKLRMRKEAPVEDEAKRRKSEEKKTTRKSKEDDRPSREEIFESYNNLVASGFFAAHAIHADSRGTKRAADEEPEEDPIQNIQRVRKLRKSASATRELTVPKLRSSSRTILSSRSFSNARAAAVAQAEAVKSSKRAVLSKIPGLQQQQQQQHSVPVPSRDSSVRRNASETYGKTLSHKTSSRVLRPRRSAAEPLRVRPNTNRGVPEVPDIPSKFTYGQDRENDGPWRGLRRAHAAQEGMNN
ncbi:unnamed protein product [Clonostachys chloroleuca]|uniref:Uncharacterized protein n=1 Tax=Clonostachys chloroleuca TaxID=1926264 RepID=A0AA35V9R3_9HYPO|nr:unnamed protein product [Clonostachys chloroleuca]